MKQVVQNIRSGETFLEDVPVPAVPAGYVLIKTRCSLVSPGTEKMLIDFGKANIFSKVRQQPERVQEVLNKIKTDGLIPTMETVFSKLDEPLPLGYSNAGEVVEMGKDVHEFSLGDRVISNGGHAEYVCVPKNLVAKIPEGVSDEDACYTVLGAVALQGIRNIQPQIGETIIVIGLGLVGLLTCSLLKANGCNVIATEVNSHRIDFARKIGLHAFHANDDKSVIDLCYQYTNNFGADAVIIAASTSNTSIINQAARFCRKKGKVVLVGVVGMELNRNEFYKKELEFIVSESYGPGRYDVQYEDKGYDYPLPYVRWTAKRNFETILQHLKNKSLSVNSFTSRKYPLHEFDKLYANISDQDMIAHILVYPQQQKEFSREVSRSEQAEVTKNKAALGIIGAGNFTRGKILPVLKKQSVNIISIASIQGLHATSLAKKYAIPLATSDYKSILQNENINSVIITTRHDMHAEMCIQAMLAGKHVFVEKPLVIQEEELEKLLLTYHETSAKSKVFTVGFNRRFSPYVQKAKTLFNVADHMHIIITVNAGYLPPDAWPHDPLTGGGRIIGEACHFIDLASFISGCKIKQVFAHSMGNSNTLISDTVSINLKMENSSTASINYFSNGHKSYPKEKIEIFCNGKICVIDNFRNIKIYGRRKNPLSFFKIQQDKGHETLLKNFVQSVETGKDLCVPFYSAVHSTRATLAVIKSLQSNMPIQVIN
ncbi:MAG: bi-domain-containing oxidoreductase [Chitinophagales bacterium]